jgi:hypothetical protein
MFFSLNVKRSFRNAADDRCVIQPPFFLRPRSRLLGQQRGRILQKPRVRSPQKRSQRCRPTQRSMFHLLEKLTGSTRKVRLVNYILLQK